MHSTPGAAQAYRRTAVPKLSSPQPFLLLLALLGFSSFAAAVDMNRRIDFHIPAQELSAALIEFSHQANIQIVTGYDLGKQTTPGITGSHPISQALEQLLSTTRLKYQVVSDTSIAIAEEKETAAGGYASAASFRLAQADPPVAPADPPGKDSAAPSSNHSSPPGSTEIGKSNSLEEIIVTAQHRVENLQDVPISAQVISGQARIEQNLNSLYNLAETVPSVHIGTAGRSNELFMRGIGSGNNSGFDQSVGIFIDDIYHGRSRTSVGTFLDVARVEVLKGPQSTYFGNNAIAGAFNIVTEKPGDAFESWMRALYGEDGQYALESAVGGPVGETVGIRAAATFNGMEGWLHNETTDEDQPNEDNMAGRLTFAYSPSETFNATLKLEGGKNKNRSGFFLQIDNCPPPAPFVAAGFCNAALGLGIPIGVESDSNSENGGQEIRLETFDSVLTADYEHWGHTFTSVSGYYQYDYQFNLDTDGTPLALLHAQAPEHYTQFSQELRIASPTGGRFEYLAGLYFQTDSLKSDTFQTYGFVSPTVLQLAPFAALIPYLPVAQAINFAQDEASYSVFGALTWNATDRLSLTGSLRGSWVEKDYDGRLLYATGTQNYGGLVPLPAALASLPAALGLGTPYTASGSRSDHAWMPSARIQYDLSSQAMTYLSYAQGFKAGGFNAVDNSGVPANVPFEPESVDAYELGLKSEWFDRRLLLNLAMFRSEYTDLQVSVNFANTAGTFVSLVRNAASSISQGVELESRWVASERFRLAANVTYLDSYYVSYPNVSLTISQTLQFNQCRAANPANLPVCESLRLQDLSGSPTQYAPRWSGSLTATFNAPLPADYGLTAELGAHFSAEYFIHPTIDDFMKQDRHTRLDGRITVQSPDRRWAVDLIGRNLSDETILTYSTNLPVSPGSLLVQKQQPRNVAIQFRYHW